MMENQLELLGALQRREPQAFAILFARYADRIFRLAVSILGNESDAEEVVQATFLSVFESIDSFVPHAQFSTWMYRIAHNHALMIVRKRHATDPIPDDDGTTVMPEALVDWSALPEERLLSEETQGQLLHALQRMPEQLRSAFVLRDMQGLHTAECSQIMSISDDACKVRLHRARLLLREMLSTYFSEYTEAMPILTDTSKGQQKI